MIKLEWIMFIRIISFQMFSASLKKQDFLFCMKHMLFLLRKSPVLNISFLFFSFLTRVMVANAMVYSSLSSFLLSLFFNEIRRGEVGGFVGRW